MRTSRSFDIPAAIIACVLLCLSPCSPADDGDPLSCSSLNRSFFNRLSHTEEFSALGVGPLVCVSAANGRR